MSIDLDGAFRVTASPAETLAFVTDPERFAPILPYFKSLSDVASDSFTLVLEVGVPQIRGQAEVAVRRTAMAADGVTYQAHGRHALGMIDATLVFALAAVPEGTAVTWTAKSTISGTLAALAQGLLLPLARRQIKTLAASVQQTLGAVPDDAAPPKAGPVGRGLASVKSLFGGATPATTPDAARPDEP